MQEGNLVEFFPQDEEHRVQVLDALGDEIPPQSSCYLSQKHENGFEGKSRQAQAEEGNAKEKEEKQTVGDMEELLFFSCLFYSTTSLTPGGYLRPTRLLSHVQLRHGAEGRNVKLNTFSDPSPSSHFF